MEIKCPICVASGVPVAKLKEGTLFKCPNCHWLFTTEKSKPFDKGNLNNDKRDEYLAIVQKATLYSGMTPGCRVLDINSGDGTLLGWYNHSVTTVGVESNVEQMKDAIKSHRVDVPIPDDFSVEKVKAISSESKFRVITAIDVFQDLDPLTLLLGSKKLLADMGVLIVQAPYFPQMLKEEFTFCRNYPLVFTLRAIVTSVGLEMQGVEFPKKGMRAYITHPNSKQFASYDFDAKLKMYTTMSASIMAELHARYDLHETYQVLEEKRQNVNESRNVYSAPTPS